MQPSVKGAWFAFLSLRPGALQRGCSAAPGQAASLGQAGGRIWHLLYVLLRSVCLANRGHEAPRYSDRTGGRWLSGLWAPRVRLVC